MKIIRSRLLGASIILAIMSGCVGYPGNYGHFYGGARNYHGYGYPGYGQYGNFGNFGNYGYGYGNYQGYQQPYRGRDDDDWNRGGNGRWHHHDND
jgi:hypothetical protein